MLSNTQRCVPRSSCATEVDESWFFEFNRRLVGVTFIFDGTLQIIVQRCQIAASFKNREQNIEWSIGCVARSGVLLKPNVANILLLNFCEQKFVQLGPIKIVIDCNGLSLFIFEENLANYASGPKFAPNSDSFRGRRLFNICLLVFCTPKCNNFACWHIRQDQNELHLKRWLSASSVSRSQSHLAQRCSSVYTNIFVRGKNKTNYLPNQTGANCYHSRKKH